MQRRIWNRSERSDTAQKRKLQKNKRCKNRRIQANKFSCFYRKTLKKYMRERKNEKIEMSKYT